MQLQVDSERRKAPRYRVKENIFALVKCGTETVGEVLNIGEGGLALKYLADDGVDLGRARVDLFAGAEIWYLTDLPVSTVSDFELPITQEFSTIRVRRMGIAFGALTEAQHRKLCAFIQENRAN